MISIYGKDQINQLEDIFSAELQSGLPDPNLSIAAVSTDRAGKVNGVWGLQLIALAGPSWIRSDAWGTNLWHKLYKALEKHTSAPKGSACYTVTQDEEGEAAAKKLGFREVKGKLWVKNF